MNFIYHRHSNDSAGLPIWSCRRLDSGIVGFGHSMELAKADFETKENTLLPYTDIDRQIADDLHREAFPNE